MELQLKDIILKFEECQREGLDKAVKFVSQNPAIFHVVSSILKAQFSEANISTPLFEWLYKCAQLKSTPELYSFCLQFTPDLVLLYLNAVYEDITQQRANAEALLNLLLFEDQSKSVLQIPSLSKSSIYHQSPSQIVQPLLTEAALQMHNEVEAIPERHSFAGNNITVNNRLQFIATILDLFCDHMMVFVDDARTSFCQLCIRLSLQGMGFFGSKLNPYIHYLPENCEGIGSMRRFSVSDSVIVSLLRGIRMCLFQSCHDLALNGLKALRMRAEYELLTNSIQVSHTLIRLVTDIKPVELQLEIEKHSSYHGPGNPDFMTGPADIHVSLNSYLLHHNTCTSESNGASSSLDRTSAPHPCSTGPSHRTTAV